eukprot:scpid62772/ scgid3106/ Abhydrolase domain-containing protein 3
MAGLTLMMQATSSGIALLQTWPVLLTIALSGGCYAVWYLRVIATRARTVGSDRMQAFLLRHVPVLEQRQWPTWWAWHAMISTLARVILQKEKRVFFRREILVLRDGGQVALDWNEPPGQEKNSRTPIVLLLPGIAGSSKEGYVSNGAAICSDLGYQSVIFSNRGQGGVSITSARGYNAACCEDLCEVLIYVQSTSPQSPMVVCGYSMGGMISSHFFGKYSREKQLAPSARADPSSPPTCIAECNVVGGIGMSMPWDPIKSRKSLESTALNRSLNRRITSDLHKFVHRCSVDNMEYKNVIESVPGGYSHVMQASTISEFDQRCVVPTFGFSSLDDYYQRASPERHIADVTIPVLYLHAADDMFILGDDLPTEKIRASQYCAMVITKWGGHLGFLEGTIPTGDTFGDKLLAQYVKAVMDHGGELQRPSA